MQPPRPTPARKRLAHRNPKLGEAAPSTENSENIASVSVNARLRPMMSAIPPQTKAPTAMPIRLEVPTQATAPLPRSHSLATSGMRKPFRVTSQASNMKPRPPMMKIAPWTFHRQGSRWTTRSPVSMGSLPTERVLCDPGHHERLTMYHLGRRLNGDRRNRRAVPVSELIYERLEDGVVGVRLNRPERRNAVDLATVEALIAALQTDPADVALLGSAVPGIFCAGADLQIG